MSSLLLPLFFSVVALVSAHPAGLAGNGISLLAQTGDDNEFDPSDLSFIKKLAAIGDSYSAGIGAGDRLGSVLDALDSQGDFACSRYDHAYPYLVNNDSALGDPSTRTFQFLSCSGALTKDILEKQIPRLNSDQQAILLSAGGNDVELTNVLNQCVYQLAVLNQEQVTVAKAAVNTEEFAWAKDFDFDTLGRGCAGQLDHTASLVGGGPFSDSLDKVLSAAKGKLAKDGKIYMTGYGKFFAEDLSTDCNKVTWSTWLYRLANMFQDDQYLTQDNRRRMNELVDSVNAKLKAAVERAGTSVVFVDYDSYVGEFHGRFCEAGVDESTKESNTRIPLMFYELSTLDPFGSTPWKRTSNGEVSGTFAGTFDQLAQITLLVDKDVQYKVPEANVTHDKPPAPAGIVSNLDLGDFEIPNVLPDGYGRVFHPQVLLHQIIANLIIYHMTSTNQQSHGLPAPPQDLAITSCPARPPQDSQPKPECQSDAPSDIPSNVFGGDKNSVYGHFCDGWVADRELKMTVDAAGNNRKPVAGLSRRTPPPNPSTWSHYNFDLSFEPKNKDAKCALDCKAAFSTMTQACSNTGSVGVLMSKSGKLDIGCGVFDFAIAGPTVPLAAQERHCFGADEFGKHGDIQPATVSSLSGWACVGTAITPIKRGDPATNIHFLSVDGKVPYQYNIYWRDGCLLDSEVGYDAVFPANPLGVKDPGHTACQDLLVDNYKKCNNGGVGGSVQVGCLVYEFKAQDSPK